MHIISNTTFIIAGSIMVNIAKLGLPMARITGFPIIAKAKKGTPQIITEKYSLAGSKICPLAPNKVSNGIQNIVPIQTKINDILTVKVTWFPNTLMAFILLESPSALEMIELPPTPIPIPTEDIKKAIGKTTVTAAIAITPIHLPTKIVSTIMFKDITNIPMDAGTACFKSNLRMLSVLNLFVNLFFL